MMNLIAITLVTTSLAVSGLFSPNPQNKNGGEDQVIVKEGHRAVIVEYADTTGHGNTKVLISPPSKPNNGPIEDHLSRAEPVDGPHTAGPRELICDAYGRCKQKITGAFSKAKEKAVEAEEEVEEAVDKAKGFVSSRTETVRENAKEKVKEAEEAAERVKDKALEKAQETTEKVKETGEKVEETMENVKEKGKKELSEIAKRGKEVVFDAIGYFLWPESMGSMMGMIQIMGFAMAYGISVWVTFIMSYVLAEVLPRQQFGVVQSKIYPVYFKAMAGSIGLALLGHLLGQRSKAFKNKAEMLQTYNLMASLLLVFANLLFLEPRATKVMFQRMKLEKEEGRGRDRVSGATRVIDTVLTDSAGPIPTTSAAPTSATAAATPPPQRPEQDEAKSKMAKLDNKLKKLNSYSSFLNILTLMGLTWHLVYLNQRLGLNTS